MVYVASLHDRRIMIMSPPEQSKYIYEPTLTTPALEAAFRIHNRSLDVDLGYYDPLMFA
jgi:hypothetical protein